MLSSISFVQLTWRWNDKQHETLSNDEVNHHYTFEQGIRHSPVELLKERVPGVPLAKESVPDAIEQVHDRIQSNVHTASTPKTSWNPSAH
jgi:hypothetical protein